MVQQEQEKWLDDVYNIKKSKGPFYYFSDRLGSPKYENGIIELCYDKRMTPQEALNWWRMQ